jgi:hypothetical protein
MTEEHDRPNDSADAPVNARRLRLLPSAWMIFYSLSIAFAGAYLFYVAFDPENRFAQVSLPTACLAMVTSVLLWFRIRLGLLGYLALAAVIVGYAAYRLFTEGPTPARIGMTIGALMMLAGYSSVAEEMPPQDADGSTP